MKTGLVFRIIAGVVAIGALGIGAFLFGNTILTFLIGPKVTLMQMDTEIFGKVEVSRAAVPVRGISIVMTDADNAEAQVDDIKALARAGIITIALDMDRVRAQLAASPASTECHYVSDDLKDLAREVENGLQLKRYFYPIVIGRGESAAFAYAVVAQAPVNTLGGAISVDFQPVLRTDRTYCFDTPQVSTGEGLFALSIPTEALSDPWRVIAPESEMARITTFQSALDEAQFVSAESDDAVRSAIIEGAVKMGGGGDHGVSDLPVAVIEPKEAV